MKTDIGTAVKSEGSISSYDPSTRYPDEPIEVDVFAFIHTKTCEVGAFSVPVRCADEMFPRINLPEHPDDLADYLTGIFEREYPNANIICYIIEDRRLCFEHCCPFWKPETGEHEGHSADGMLSISTEEPSESPPPTTSVVEPGGSLAEIQPPQHYGGGDAGLPVEPTISSVSAKKEGVE